MSERVCFVCRQGFGGRRRTKVRAFISDEAWRDEEVCVSCVAVLRRVGYVDVERDGVQFVVRELHPPEPVI